MYSREVFAFETWGGFVSICAFAKRSVTVYIFGTCSVSMCTFGVSIYRVIYLRSSSAFCVNTLCCDSSTRTYIRASVGSGDGKGEPQDRMRPKVLPRLDHKCAIF